MEKQYGHNQRLCTIVVPALLKMTPVLLMVSGVGAMSVGSQVTPRPEEVLVNCSLTEDVRQTKHGVVIRAPSHSGDDHPVTVLDCEWLKVNPDKPDCISHYGFTLEALGKDSVVVRVPRTQLQNGSYTCLLVPQDKKEAFTTCRVPPDDAEDPPTTISAVTPSTAADQPQPCDQKGGNGDHPGGLVAAVVALSFTVFILLLMVIVMAVLFLRPRRDQFRRTPVVRNEEQPINGVASTGTNSEHHQGSPLLRKDEKPKMNGVAPPCGTSMTCKEQDIDLTPFPLPRCHYLVAVGGLSDQ